MVTCLNTQLKTKETHYLKRGCQKNWIGNSNGSWTNKYSSHFSTVKKTSVKATFFFM